MTRRRFSLPPVAVWPASAWLLLVVNLVPLAGALWLNWQVLDLLMLFWLENLVIGLFNLVRMATAADRVRVARRIFLMAFFTLHYGGFAFAHGVALLSLFGPSEPGLPGAAALWATFQASALRWAALALLISHAVSMIMNDWRSGERQRQSVSSLMTRPYQRVMALHVTILVGGLAVSLLGAPVWALVVLVLVKMAMDLTLHLREHSGGLIMKAAEPPARPVTD